MNQKTTTSPLFPSIPFGEFYTNGGLERLDDMFATFVKTRNEALYNVMISARQEKRSLSDHRETHPDFVALAILLEAFLADFFHIQNEKAILQNQIKDMVRLADFRQHVIQKRILLKFHNHVWKDDLGEKFRFWIEMDNTELVSRLVQAREENARGENNDLEMMEEYIAWRCLSTEGRRLKPTSPLFQIPRQTDYFRPFDYMENDNIIQAYPWDNQIRHGFNLVDKGPDPFHAATNARYCLKCHKTGKDSCRKGLLDPNGDPRINPLQNKLTGCPLDQKIPEMCLLHEWGFSLAALAVITIDNPMVAATGYRICNDCEKACIFQKQTPVDIPSIETRILKDVLELPWGFEIYSLLTRWNPLHGGSPIPAPESGYSIMIAGMGPAGYTLAHYLLQQGHHVVGFDGLKLEPLPSNLTGKTDDGNIIPFQPIRDISVLMEPLDKRTASGFGGVSEYGITARWNKNFLQIIRLILERHPRFHLFGQTRFGGSINAETAHNLGFDHIALCLGAGKPSFVPINNAFPKGVRTASEFLMGLQLTGAIRDDSMAHMQIRLPLVVVGGGLTAIDAATEALAWYPVQVERFQKRYHHLCSVLGQEKVEASWSPEDRLIAREYLEHATALSLERKKATEENRQHDFRSLLSSWGGVTVIYRKTLQQSPAFRISAREIHESLAQGIIFMEKQTPRTLLTDEYGFINSVELLSEEGETIQIPVRSLLFATGTQPNTGFMEEHPEGFFSDIEDTTKNRPFIKSQLGSHYISIFGDLDPEYAGSVVKAMASAKNGAPSIGNALKNHPPRSEKPGQPCLSIKSLLDSHVVQMEKIHEAFTLFTISSPLAAKACQPGQFFRLQVFTDATNSKGIIPGKGVAVTPVDVDPEKGHIRFLLSHAGSSMISMEMLQPGSRVALMGPTGCPSQVPSNKEVLIVAQGFYALLLRTVIQAISNAGSRISLFIPNGMGKEMLELLPFPSMRIVTEEEEMQEVIPKADHILVMGGSAQLQDFRKKFKDGYYGTSKPSCAVVASINSPMQCMMKEICGQCIQRHQDPLTGMEKYIFSCAHQDQPFESLDTPMLQGRHQQNSLMDKITRLWMLHGTA